MLDVINHGQPGDSDFVRELRMARPPANALNIGLIDTLAEKVSAAPDDGCRALILSGAPKMFSAGLDVVELIEFDRDGVYRLWSSYFSLLRLLAESTVPVVSAITGHSPAGGAVMTLYCDYRIMADGDFKIGCNEVRVGLILPEAIQVALAYVVGDRQAERLGVPGLLISPKEAYRVGLVDELADIGATVDRALEWAKEMAKLPQVGMRTTRHFARRNLHAAFEYLDEAHLQLFVDRWFSDETQRTLRGLVDKLKQSKK